MCGVLENQITYDGKHVPSRALCPCRGIALKKPPRNSKYAIILEKIIVFGICVYNPSRKNVFLVKTMVSAYMGYVDFLKHLFVFLIL